MSKIKKPMLKEKDVPRNDEYYTPTNAVRIIAPYIPKDAVIWECTDYGSSKITEHFRELGHKVINTHLKDDKNFLNYEPEEHYDIIITNPPYSIKDDFLKRAYELGKPFAFLLPLESLGGQKRVKMYIENSIEILVPHKRVQFVRGGNAWFPTGWFCWNILPEKLIFCELED